MKKVNIERCVICGGLFIGWGNNPYPLYKNGRCCDVCNSVYVIPTRIALLGASSEEEYEAEAMKMRREIKSMLKEVSL